MGVAPLPAQSFSCEMLWKRWLYGRLASCLVFENMQKPSIYPPCKMPLPPSCCVTVVVVCVWETWQTHRAWLEYPHLNGVWRRQGFGTLTPVSLGCETHTGGRGSWDFNSCFGMCIQHTPAHTHISYQFICMRPPLSVESLSKALMSSVAPLPLYAAFYLHQCTSSYSDLNWNLHQEIAE